MIDIAALDGVIEKLFVTLEEEKDLLNAKRFDDLDDIIDKKCRIIIELVRISRTIPEGLGDASNLNRKDFRSALQENSRLLRAHLQAAESVSSLVRDSVNEESNDGTYSATRINKAP